MGNAIEIEGLRKAYRRRRGRTVAIDGLDLTVPEGGVFGFLGPNGSGKTTTIRCLLGLARPTDGSLQMLGRAVPAELDSVIGRTGAIVETPALFPTMTATENLRLLAAIAGIGSTRVAEVLETVGLTERAHDLVRSYSLGMRQRLGLGAALLKDPALLILDEPANGLDPVGMREVRHLVRRLADEGRTVFVSSHILAEVEQTCDRVAIISRGRCVASGTVAEVMARTGRESSVFVSVDDLVAGARVLDDAGMPNEPVAGGLRVHVDATQCGRISMALAGAGLWVTELRPQRANLEDVFLELTARPGPEVAA